MSNITIVLLENKSFRIHSFDCAHRAQSCSNFMHLTSWEYFSILRWIPNFWYATVLSAIALFLHETNKHLQWKFFIRPIWGSSESAVSLSLSLSRAYASETHSYRCIEYILNAPSVASDNFSLHILPLLFIILGSVRVLLENNGEKEIEK